MRAIRTRVKARAMNSCDIDKIHAVFTEAYGQDFSLEETGTSCNIRICALTPKKSVNWICDVLSEYNLISWAYTTTVSDGMGFRIEKATPSSCDAPIPPSEADYTPPTPMPCSRRPASFMPMNFKQATSPLSRQLPAKRATFTLWWYVMAAIIVLCAIAILYLIKYHK